MKTNPMLTYILESVQTCSDCPVYHDETTKLPCSTTDHNLVCRANIEHHFDMLTEQGLDHFEYLEKASKND